MHPEQPASIPPPRQGRSRRHKQLTGAQRFWAVCLEIIIVLALAVGVSTLIRQFVFQVYSIPSQSMEQTLQVGDRIIVNRIPGVGKDIKRGDVVVFQDAKGWLPDDATSGNSAARSIGEFLGIIPANGEQVIVKRVIGKGGDSVSCCTADGKLEVNGTAIDEPYLATGEKPSETSFSVVVPEGKLWVMGDNRSHSADSRAHLNNGNTSFIDESDVIGKVQWVAWPFNHWSSVAHRETFQNVPDPS